MPRPRSSGEPTRLGAELRQRRGVRSLADLGQEVGLSGAAIGRLECGNRFPSPATARKLAAWLGWSVGQVFDAAEERVEQREVG